MESEGVVSDLSATYRHQAREEIDAAIWARNHAAIRACAFSSLRHIADCMGISVGSGEGDAEGGAEVYL